MSNQAPLTVPQFRLQRFHILTNLHVQNLSINHRLLQRPMPKHLRNRLNRHLITQRHSSSERMPGNVKSQRLGNPAQVSNLLQISIHLLIVSGKQQCTKNGN
jgi:hypothetical protein